jgi:hypothetical protein
LLLKEKPQGLGGNDVTEPTDSSVGGTHGIFSRTKMASTGGVRPDDSSTGGDVASGGTSFDTTSSNEGSAVGSGGVTSTVVSGGVTSGGSGGVTSTVALGGVSSGGTASTVTLGGTATGGTATGGTATGGTATGGTATGGTTSSTTGGATYTFNCSAVNSLLIDNMEDQDKLIIPCNDRQGEWFSFVSANDWEASLTLDVPKVSRGMVNGISSSYAVKLTGRTTKNGDCGVGVRFNSLNSPYFDLSRYDGIRFSYKTEGLPADTELLGVQLLLPSTVEDGLGGDCRQSSAICDDHYSVKLTPSNDWTEAKFLLNTATFKRVGWGTAGAAFELNRALGVQIVVRKSSTQPPFVIYVDDLYLVNL